MNVLPTMSPKTPHPSTFSSVNRWYDEEIHGDQFNELTHDTDEYEITWNFFT